MSTKRAKNPLEAMVDDLADRYVGLVEELTQTFAPMRPWYSPDLTPDEQLWRYLEQRDAIVGWLTDAGAAMLWSSWQETLTRLEELFTSPVVIDRLPMDLIVDERGDVVRQLVQASGPKEAAKHIRKMEKMIEGRAQATQQLDTARKGFNFPDIPPPLPIAPALEPASATAAGQPYQLPPGVQLPQA
jgi:hypothetical protein